MSTEPQPELEPQQQPTKITDIPVVEFFLSTFPYKQGLFPSDWKPNNQPLGKDYNPNRIITATWQNGVWTWYDGISKIVQKGANTELVLPVERMLTAGQKYHWGVRLKGFVGNLSFISYKDGEFELPTAPFGNQTTDTFSSVTVLTRGLSPQAYLADTKFEAIASHLTRKIGDQDNAGLLLRYKRDTGKWYWTDNNNQRRYNIPENKFGKPLVLLADWANVADPSKLNITGSAEASADALFASLVQLDQQLGGSVGENNQLYNPQGKLIRTQGALFNSPLHFIGFGQGAVVNTEIVQRLGTFFPGAGGRIINGSPSPERDLHVTTIDPYSYGPNSPSGYNNILDPEVVTWNNVTYADNYYQQQGTGNTLNGQELDSADWNVNLGNRAGFDQAPSSGAPHQKTLTWYAGTANVSGSNAQK